MVLETEQSKGPVMPVACCYVARNTIVCAVFIKEVPSLDGAPAYVVVSQRAYNEHTVLDRTEVRSTVMLLERPVMAPGLDNAPWESLQVGDIILASQQNKFVGDLPHRMFDPAPRKPHPVWDPYDASVPSSVMTSLRLYAVQSFGRLDTVFAQPIVGDLEAVLSAFAANSGTNPVAVDGPVTRFKRCEVRKIVAFLPSTPTSLPTTTTDVAAHRVRQMVGRKLLGADGTLAEPSPITHQLSSDNVPLIAGSFGIGYTLPTRPMTLKDVEERHL